MDPSRANSGVNSKIKTLWSYIKFLKYTQLFRSLSLILWLSITKALLTVNLVASERFFLLAKKALSRYIKLLCNPFVLGKLASIICGDCFKHLSFIWQQQASDCFCKRFCVLSMFQLLHECKVRRSFHKHKYSIACFIHYQVHFPVSKTLSIGFSRSIVYTDTILYIGSFSPFALRKSTNSNKLEYILDY